MMQVPIVSDEAVVPETEQIVGVVEVYMTVKPEEAVAVRPTLVSATWVGTAGKVMVCAARGNREAPVDRRATAGP